MILDFNSTELDFHLKDIGKYNLNTIYDNIDKFKNFTHESVIFDTFNKIYNSEIFQIALLDDTTCYLDNLLVTYNVLASMGDTKLPEITEKQLKEQLLIKGFIIKRTTKTVIPGVTENAYKVTKEERIW